MYKRYKKIEIALGVVVGLAVLLLIAAIALFFYKQVPEIIVAYVIFVLPAALLIGFILYLPIARAYKHNIELYIKENFHIDPIRNKNYMIIDDNKNYVLVKTDNSLILVNVNNYYTFNAVDEVSDIRFDEAIIQKVKGSKGDVRTDIKREYFIYLKLKNKNTQLKLKTTQYTQDLLVRNFI